MCDTLLSKYEVTYKNSKFRRFLYADRNREQEYIKKEGDFFFFFLVDSHGPVCTFSSRK